MTLASETVGDFTILEPEIETLDTSNAKEFREAVEPFLKPGAKVVFDLNRIRFIDSTGLGVILSCLKHLVADGGDLRLCCLRPAVRSTFALVRLDQILRVLDTREEAIRA